MQLFAGFDLGGTHLKYGLIDVRGDVFLECSVESPKSADELFKLIGSIIKELKKRCPGTIKGAGLGFPGIFHIREQKIIQSPNFPSLDGREIVAELSPLIDIPFCLNNDANFAAYAESVLGAGQETESLVLLTVGTGIGTGIIIDGKIWQGACGFAGELGHVCVKSGGDECKCGSRGCLETEVSAPKIVSRYRALSDSTADVTPEKIFRLAEKGDAAALKSVTRAGYFLGIGLSLAINFLNPEKILIGGGVMDSGDLLLSHALRETKRRSFTAAFECCRIERTRLGNRAGYIGAALWARNNHTQPAP